MRWLPRPFSSRSKPRAEDGGLSRLPQPGEIWHSCQAPGPGPRGSVPPLSIEHLWRVVNLDEEHVSFRNCMGKELTRSVSIFLSELPQVRKDWSPCQEPGRMELEQIQASFVQGLIDQETLESATEEIMAHLSRLNEPVNRLPAGLVSPATVANFADPSALPTPGQLPVPGVSLLSATGE